MCRHTKAWREIERRGPEHKHMRTIEGLLNGILRLEQYENHNSRSNSRSDSRKWWEPKWKIFTCPSILGAFFRELGWSPRARNIGKHYLCSEGKKGAHFVATIRFWKMVLCLRQFKVPKHYKNRGFSKHGGKPQMALLVAKVPFWSFLVFLLSSLSKLHCFFAFCPSTSFWKTLLFLVNFIIIFLAFSFPNVCLFLSNKLS